MNGFGGIKMDSDKKALMKRKIEENRIKQRQIRINEEKRRLKENGK